MLTTAPERNAPLDLLLYSNERFTGSFQGTSINFSWVLSIPSKNN